MTRSLLRRRLHLRLHLFMFLVLSRLLLGSDGRQLLGLCSAASNDRGGQDNETSRQTVRDHFLVLPLWSLKHLRHTANHINNRNRLEFTGDLTISLSGDLGHGETIEVLVDEPHGPVRHQGLNATDVETLGT